MYDYEKSLAYKPEYFGLEPMLSYDQGESYEWDVFSAWRDVRDGSFLYGNQSGCSCSSPWENGALDLEGLKRTKDWGEVEWAAIHWCRLNDRVGLSRALGTAREKARGA